MKYAATLAATLMLFSGSANALGRAEMLKAVQELGVSPRVMIACAKQSGMKSGQNLSEEQRAEAGTLMLACLRQANPALSQEQFVATMTVLRRNQN